MSELRDPSPSGNHTPERPTEIDLDALEWLGENAFEWLAGLASIGAWQIGAESKEVAKVIDALIAEHVELRVDRKVVAWVREYGVHPLTCAGERPGAGLCDCGINAALAELDAGK